MTILITGRDGQIGRELERSLRPIGDIVAVGRAQCDLAKPGDIAALVRDIRPAVIVNAAAFTAVDKAEKDEALATAVNATAVATLAQEARRIGALLVHYSTDYVFDGSKPAPYLESDNPRPLNAYGRSKLKGEQAIGDAGGDYLILRTSWVYAARGHNFVNTILRQARERDTLRIVNDQHGAPTWARTVADATAQILRQAADERQTQQFASGIFHLAAGGRTTWYDFAHAIIGTYRTIRPSDPLKATQIVPIPTGAYPTAAQRPKNSLFDTTAVQRRFGVTVPQWDAALRRCLDEYP